MYGKWLINKDMWK